LNLEAAKAVCKALDIDDQIFYKAISSFKGASKRLELMGHNADTNIYKDFAHSPSKLSATIKAVKVQFPNRKLIACMELHTFSSLNKAFLNEYKGTMDDADEAIVFIDKHTYLQKNMEPYPSSVVKEAFKKTNLLFFDDPKVLFSHLKQLYLKDRNLLMMSSGTFAGTDLSLFAESIL
jgi:UDP-N-acetylmuramate: L-alanyl-gamma-D-glutamyl-meso-diaminopimelate ligase